MVWKLIRRSSKERNHASALQRSCLNGNRRDVNAGPRPWHGDMERVGILGIPPGRGGGGGASKVQ
jgi:hypothetical protein